MADASSIPEPSTAGPPARRTRLLELALLFGRLGTTAFGGPAVHVAMMEDEVVRRRLTREEFLDLCSPHCPLGAEPESRRGSA